MASFTVPTSKDIYIEVDGRKLAVVEGYKAQSSRESRYIEAFGESEPVGTIGGRTRHQLELSRVVLSAEGLQRGVSFYDLDDFNLVIVRPDRRTVYAGCRWANIAETANLGDPVLEAVTIIAARRTEL